MIYQLVKAIHITAVITFIGGLLMLSVSVKTNNLPVLRAVRRWDRFFTTPALGLVWITGLTIAMQGHWFGEVWLTIKLLGVAALSAMHGVLAGVLRRTELDATAATPGVFRRAGMADMAVVATVTVIVFLVIFKPA